uniref:Zinc transporter ZIP3 n=1 Tax=Angiostrongylus cantonensis TaxID=6313 RepID=A0A0K0D590_ANGCA
MFSFSVFTTLAVAEPERCETNCEKVDEDPPILMKSSPHAHSHGVRSITFVLALSIHSVIEGIAFGVGDNASETTALFLSLLVHKLIVSFSVGLQLARTHAHQLHWVVASVFVLALMSPLGAVVGMVVQSAAANSFSKDVAITILQGLAVGTFLYVTFFEVLLHERDNEHPNLLKLLVMLVGFSLIGLLRLIDNHDHSDFSHSLENGTSLTKK